VHDELAPRLVKTVAIAWHLALVEAGADARELQAVTA